jgi:hypothetical protein
MVSKPRKAISDDDILSLSLKLLGIAYDSSAKN